MALAPRVVGCWRHGLNFATIRMNLYVSWWSRRRRLQRREYVG